MKFELDIDEKQANDYLRDLLKKEVKNQIERYVNSYETQNKIRRAVADQMERSLVGVVAQLASESKAMEDQVRSTLLKKLTNKVVKEVMES
jgi:hypothetical protein